MKAETVRRRRAFLLLAKTVVTGLCSIILRWVPLIQRVGGKVRPLSLVFSWTAQHAVCSLRKKKSQQLAEKFEAGYFCEYLIVVIYQPVAPAQWVFAACRVYLFLLPFLILLKVNRVSFDEGGRFHPANLVAAVDGNAVENVCCAFGWKITAGFSAALTGLLRLCRQWEINRGYTKRLRATTHCKTRLY